MKKEKKQERMKRIKESGYELERRLSLNGLSIYDSFLAFW